MAKQVRLWSGEPGGLAVLLSQPFRPFGDDVLDLHVSVTAAGLDARLWVRTIAGDGLLDFVRDLVRDFRGWSGPRTWHSLEGDLSIEARHTGGRVWLDVRLAPTVPEAGWAVSATVLVPPGEDLIALATDLADLLG